jgi:hypothetical protein
MDYKPSYKTTVKEDGRFYLVEIKNENPPRVLNDVSFSSKDSADRVVRVMNEESAKHNVRVTLER